MNKKLLFAAMSFAALTACSTDDFESQQQVAEGVSPIQFEVINNSETTRAHMDGNTIKWDANDGDLFTLYHGGAASTYLTGYENATYTAQAGEEGKAATLTTPSMIKSGKAIMVWPVDTTFRAKDKLTIVIPEELTKDKKVEDNIPYVSDLIDIKDYKAYTEGKNPTAYNTAGKDRKYTVYMRPMASQLILKADYAGTDAKINALATGADPINPIALTSVDLVSGATTQFTKEIALTFTDPSSDIQKRWTDAKNNNAWSHVTGFDKANIGTTGKQTVKLTTTCINGLESAKFLMLPQADIDVSALDKGVENAAIVFNTLYGKVTVADPATVPASKYTAAEIEDAWYRYQKAGAEKKALEKETKTAGTGDDAGKVRYTNNIALGLAQVINAFSTNETKKEGSIVKDEPTGAVGTRYVKVLLSHLDMQGLHITNDKHLYDAVRVWKEIGAKNTDITVYLDGDKDGNFEISKKTIAKINEINAATAAEKRSFKVMPCKDDECKTIVITGGDEMPQDLTFILANSGTKAAVALKAGESWKWNSKNVMVDATATGVSKIINKGTLVSDANATLKIFDNSSADPKNPKQIYTINFENDGEWNITAGTLNVQFTVTNNGKVNIAKGAQYRQDGKDNNFTNEAATLPERFFTAQQIKDKEKEQIGVVNNSGVFATVNDANINNYGLIEHLEKDAKTYITTNQNGSGFDAAFDKSTNKMGRINLPFDNKDEDNISIKGDAKQGFVSVTVTSDNAPADKKLDASKVGTYVNYVIINSGIEEITNVNDQVKYIEFNDKDKKEIAWLPRFDKAGNPIAYPYTGLIVLSPVNIKLKTTVNVSGSTYIAADMYVGGTFKPNKYDGYFGDTKENSKTMYITY